MQPSLSGESVLNASSGWLSPRPIALSTASFRVQQRKKMSGRSSALSVADGGKFRRMEVAGGDFERTFDRPHQFDVDADLAAARDCNKREFARVGQVEPQITVRMTRLAARIDQDRDLTRRLAQIATNERTQGRTARHIVPPRPLGDKALRPCDFLCGEHVLQSRCRLICQFQRHAPNMNVAPLKRRKSTRLRPIQMQARAP